jgi:hypothetical protein
MLIRNVDLDILMPRGKKKGLNTKKFDRCVSKVKSTSGKKSILTQFVMPAWAVKQSTKVNSKIKI